MKEYTAGAEAGAGKGTEEQPAAAEKSGEKAKGKPPETAGAVDSLFATVAAAAAAAVAPPAGTPLAAPARACAGAVPIPTTPAWKTVTPLPPRPLASSTIAIVSSVSATADEQSTEKKVWLATFLECQRRELERTKESCREELEALKQRLREKMRDAQDQQAKARESFCGRLYGTDAAAEATATAAVTATATAGAAGVAGGAVGAAGGAGGSGR